MVFDSIFQSINGENIFFMKIVEEGRVSSFFGDELKMGGYLMRFTPLLFALSLYYLNLDNNFKFQFIGSIIIFLISISIFLSGERTSFFLFILTIVFFLIFLDKLKISDNTFPKFKFIELMNIFVVIIYNSISIKKDTFLSNFFK